MKRVLKEVGVFILFVIFTLISLICGVIGSAITGGIDAVKDQWDVFYGE